MLKMQQPVYGISVERTNAAARKECSKCILHEGIKSVKVGVDGTCNYCKDPALLPIHQIPEVDRLRFEADLEATLRAAKGQGKRLGTDGEYDIVMGLSGGKDSTLLLYTLTHKYGLKVLPVAVDMGFLPKVAKDNISQTCKVMGITFVLFDGVARHFMELYRWIFAHRKDPVTNPNMYNLMLTGQVCGTCSDLLEGFVIKEAAKRRIPLVLFGLSPDQNRRFTYEIPRTRMEETWVPDFALTHTKDFTPEFLAAWWNPAKFSVIPRVISPNHAWKYSEAETIVAVEKLGLIPPKKADPLVTNCDVLWALSVYDARVYGCNVYIFPFANLVREGKADRSKWKKIFDDMKDTVAQGIFRGPEIRKFYRLLGFSLKEVLALADAEK